MILKISDTYYIVCITRKTDEMLYYDEFSTRLTSILYAPKISYVDKAGWLVRQVRYVWYLLRSPPDDYNTL